jgi:5-methylcytosine-specific restriction endonuclease McrA
MTTAGSACPDWLRKPSPFCELCGSTEGLSTDHVIPLSEELSLRLEPLNTRVLCQSCNSRRKNTCTDDERQAVRAAIAARKRRALDGASPGDSGT